MGEREVAGSGLAMPVWPPSERSWWDVLDQWDSDDKVAISDDRSRSLTFAELARQARRSAGMWQERGVDEGMVVVLLGRNSVELLVNLLGLSRLGALPLMVNWRLTTTELAALGEVVHPVAVAADADLLDGARAIGPDTDLMTVRGTASPQAPSTEEVRGTTTTEPPLRAGETFCLLHTSGTTGLPKLIALDHRAHVWGCRLLAQQARLGSEDIHLRFTPMFHLAGLQEIFCALLSGGRTVLRPSFDPHRWLDDVEAHRATVGHLPPVTLRRVVEAWQDRERRPDLDSLREVWYGTAPARPDVVSAALRDLGCDLRQIYGMTEAQAPVSMLQPEDHRHGGDRIGSAGRPLPAWELRVVGPDGADVRTGDPGEVWIRGPLLFSGYWTRGGARGAGVDADGWYATGDVARVDREGFLYVVDRIRDMIVSGGENIFAAEVEMVLARHPDIAEVAVVAIPSERWGEAVHAVVVARPDHVLDTAALDAWTRDRLSTFKCPGSWEVVTQLPRNASGKVLKRHLRESHWRGVERGVS